MADDDDWRSATRPLTPADFEDETVFDPDPKISDQSREFDEKLLERLRKIPPAHPDD